MAITRTDGPKDGKKNLVHLLDTSGSDAVEKSPNISKKAKIKKNKALAAVASLEIEAKELESKCVSANPQEQAHLNEYLYMLPTNSNLIRKFHSNST
jgi:hypothetical protein